MNLSSKPILSDSEATSIQFEDAVDEFEDCLLAGKEPRIEDYLARIKQAEFDKAIVQLIEIEAEYRLDLMQQVEQKEYEDRFPGYAQQVVQAFSQLKEDREGLDPRFRIRPGVKVDQFTLGKELGRGGVAIVYHAHEGELNRHLAIKTLNSSGIDLEDARRADAFRRLKSEAAITAGLSHPGIPPVFAVGELPNGSPYFCMRLIEGKTFSELLAENKAKDLPVLLKVFEQVTQTLSSAHQAGIIHRDMKPSNIMVGKYGEVQVMDWGMAKDIKDIETSSGPDESQTATMLESLPVNSKDFNKGTTVDLPLDTSVEMQGSNTAQWTVLGTLAYMSPEQAQGRIADHDTRTDVFALGGILCHILLGHPPYQGSSQDGIWKKAQTGQLEETFTKLDRVETDKELTELAKRCLATDPAARPHSAQEVANILRKYTLSVEARLKYAEIERVRETARADEEENRAKLERSKRRVAVGLLGAILALVLVGVSSVLFFNYQQAQNEFLINQERTENDQTRTHSLVSTLLNAPPAAVPYAIESLLPLGEYAVPELVLVLKDESRDQSQRLHAACALAAFELFQTEALVGFIPNCHLKECENIISALQDDDNAIRLLQDHAGKETRTRARNAIVRLHLGDSLLFEEMAQHRNDPIQRTILVDTLSRWHGDLTKLAEFADQTGDNAACSALCLGVSEIAVQDIQTSQVDTWGLVLARLFRESGDQCTHSAATKAMQSWGLNFPDIQATGQPQAGKSWLVSPQQVTMMVIPAGQFSRQAAPKSPIQTIEVPRGFLISDREISAMLYQQFIISKDQKTLQHQAAVKLNMPAANLNWNDAIQFCNWLSQEEGLQPCYTRVDEQWNWNKSANGYRLPTEIEWEYAARANTNTRYSHGNDLSLLKKYAVYETSQAAPCASKLPNAFGLFDMHGNLREWCFDVWNESGPITQGINPLGGTSNQNHVLQGGYYSQTETIMRSGYRSFGLPSWDGLETGFRVARNQP
ncbi:MAG: hypothetical protein COA78_15700 [Blastopirellula sp.]|nr:MAG: hypothetical protein COA78_15700 [Blastopirellula sp.]